jgi:hypothetical protein
MNQQLKINDFVVRFANVNGTGSASANALFTKAVFRMGVPVTAKNIFPSNIQGLPTWYEVRISEKGYLGRREGVDLMVAVNPQSMKGKRAQEAPHPQARPAHRRQSPHPRPQPLRRALAAGLALPGRKAHAPPGRHRMAAPHRQRSPREARLNHSASQQRHAPRGTDGPRGERHQSLVRFCLGPAYQGRYLR